MTTQTDTAPRFTARIITLFPEVFPGPLGVSLAGRALEAGIWRLQTHQLRDFATDKHASVDDTPAGGGPGMVMRPDVAARAIDHVSVAAPDAPVIYPSPRGRPADQALMRELAAAGDVVLLCGRFEGLDERVLECRPVAEISMGDFVLSGGEIAAMAMVDAVVRLLPGVVGDPATLNEESFETGLLEYPQYTRPAEWEGMEIPSVLMSGHHEKIRAWRRAAAEELTRERRPDLWNRYKNERGKP